MARFKIARTGLVALLILCCIAAYYTHSKIWTVYTQESPTSLDNQDFKLKNPLRQLGGYIEWSWPPHIHLLESQEASDKREEERLVFSQDGLVRNWEDGKEAGYTKLSSRVRHIHPINQLIQRGQDRWKGLLERQSKTLSQAVAEYKRRYGRPPPKGFKGWYKFARRNDIKIVDDIHRDIEPFFGLSPSHFRQRRDELAKAPHSYAITLDPNGPSRVTGIRGSLDRPQLLFKLIEPVAQYLPAKITIYGSDHDLGSSLLDDEQLQAILKAVEQKRYISEGELKGFEDKYGKGEVKGLVAACPIGSLSWNQSLTAQEGGVSSSNGMNTESTFIHYPAATYDFCHHPSLRHHHGSYSFDQTRSSRLRPFMQWSKQLRNADLLTTPLEAYSNTSVYTPWTEKIHDKVFWRGSTTGDAYVKGKFTDGEGGWRMSHRPRLALMAQETEGVRKVWVQRGEEWRLEEWSREELNGEYLDIGLTGRPHQCDIEDGTCQEMQSEINWAERVNPEEAANSNVNLFDIDGNGWSSRFHRLLMSGSVVLKSTIYPEWNSDWLIPWIHYVPIQVYYSDLYNVISFFSGPPSSNTDSNSNVSQGGKGNDDLAREIAENARKFGEEHWRWVDMQGYMFRLLLEYSRLEADDRDAASYHRNRT